MRCKRNTNVQSGLELGNPKHSNAQASLQGSDNYCIPRQQRRRPTNFAPHINHWGELMGDGTLIGLMNIKHQRAFMQGEGHAHRVLSRTAFLITRVALPPSNRIPTALRVMSLKSHQAGLWSQPYSACGGGGGGSVPSKASLRAAPQTRWRSPSRRSSGGGGGGQAAPLPHP